MERNPDYLNVTRSMVTINTNTDVRALSEFDYQQLLLEFEAGIERIFTESQFTDIIFGPGQLISSINIDSFDIEQGPTNGFLHAHVVVTIHHDVPRYNIRNWQNSMVEILQQLPEWSHFNGAYVRADLLDSRGENYARKKARAKREKERQTEYTELQNQRPIEYYFIQSELDRLQKKGGKGKKG